MIVVTLTDCPPKLRGDLSKWLFEINNGVYVGNLSTRVREELWERICGNLSSGRATMVFNAPGEQRLDFLVHNTSWKPRDFDGLKLMCRPPAVCAQGGAGGELCNAALRQKVKNIAEAKRRLAARPDYTVIDLETTGLSAMTDEILEFAALRIREGVPEASFSALVRPLNGIPADIAKLTGITAKMLEESGKELGEALRGFISFVGADRIVGHNVSFDQAFLRAACKKSGLPPPINSSADTLHMARKAIDDIDDYTLSALAKYLSVPTQHAHRALDDCRTVYGIYSKLNEN